MNNIIDFNKERVEEILSKLEDKNKELKETYVEVRKMESLMNGESDTWQGKGQEKFYNNFKSIIDKFDLVTSSLENSNEYLRNVIDNYSSFDSNISGDINKSNEN